MSTRAPAEVIVVTGAAGRVGRELVPLLRREGRLLRLLDIAVPDASVRDARDEWIAASITDRRALASAFAGATAVIHLAGYAAEHTWAHILEVNIDGAQAVLEQAQAAAVRRVMLASSYHVVGYETPDKLHDCDVLPPRPDTYYAVSKAAVEALGSVFADRFDMTVVSARIVTFGPLPAGPRGLAQWLSPADLARLTEAVVALATPGHRIVWAVSDNSPGWFPLEAGRAIGYEPRDNASETLAARAAGPPVGSTPADLAQLDATSILGYAFATPQQPLGHPMSL